MFSSFLAGSPFPQPPRPGRRRQRRKQNNSKRDTTTGRQSASTTNGGQKGNLRTGSSSGTGKPVAGGKGTVSNPNWLAEQWGKYTDAVGKSVKDLQSRSKKFEVPVKVDVDWVKPTLTSMREMSVETWNNLPPGVQRVSPYVVVSLLTAFIVQKLNNRRIDVQRNTMDELQIQIVSLLKENKGLEKKIRELQEGSFSSPRMANELKMASAVAQATMAAAQAADAAAAAAQACGLRVRRAVAGPKQSPPVAGTSTG